MADENTQQENIQPVKNVTGKIRTTLIFTTIGLFAAIVFGLLWLFFLSPALPTGNLGWFLFSFAAGLSMIVLPCTLPLAFVIVPLSMGRGLVKGLGMALSFGLGVALMLSIYGVLAALVGGVAIDALGAPLETVKNWVYLIAGIFALIFALGEIGLLKVRMPSYTGAAPAFIQKRKDYLKAFLLGVFLGNIGVGCPHPATPLLFIEIASSGDVLYGWLLFLVHAIGRVLPLLLLAFLGILGVNGLAWLVARKEKVERFTGWAMVFVAGFILTLGLFTHDWWVNSGMHSLIEEITQEDRLIGIVAENLESDVVHLHGIAEGKGLFGLPLSLGNYFIVLLWVFPVWWWWLRKRRRVKLISEEEMVSKQESSSTLLTYQGWFIITLTITLALVFSYILPHNFTQHKALQQDDHDNEVVVNDVHLEGETFSQDIIGLPDAVSTQVVELQDGDEFELVASIVKKEVGNRVLRMLAYNGSVPGPIIKVEQGAQITIHFKNNTDMLNTLHSHGVRADNLSDGVPFVTQDPVEAGGEYTYTIKFPDAGLYWYHPHTRDDYGQEVGLYGNYIVEPLDTEYWSPVNREVPLVIDDILIENDQISLFYKDFTNFALLGRFGNEFLVNGEKDFLLEIKQGEVIRFLTTNVSNARTYKLSIPGAELKLVGADISKFEQEQFISDFLISPAERIIFEAYFEEPGLYKLMHITPDNEYQLAFIHVSGESVTTSYTKEFKIARRNADVIREVEPLRKQYLSSKPDKQLLLTVDLGEAEIDHDEHAHNEGAVLLATEDDHDHDEHAHSSGATGEAAIQWEDMQASDKVNTTQNVVWKLIDIDTGKENMDIDWTFTKGEYVKVRLTNDQAADHVMQHPIHFHGQRFLILSENGVPNENMAWKDTVLVLPGVEVDILVEMNNTGEWMSHCHIAEHLHAGMMFSFRVEDENGKASGDEYRATLAQVVSMSDDREEENKENNSAVTIIEDGHTDHVHEFIKGAVWWKNKEWWTLALISLLLMSILSFGVFRYINKEI